MKLRNLLLVIPLVLLASCGEPNTSTPGVESSANVALNMTKGLEDCKLYEFKDRVDASYPLKIVRCPNSTVSTTTTVNQNKQTIRNTIITIDGVEYAPIVKKENET